MRTAASTVRVAPRRTQAERRESTRKRILDAVVASIAEVGFQRTTATRIAARAGITWGAVQHHYGGKEGILTAVLDDSFARLAEHFADLEALAARPIEARTCEFLARAWRHFGSPQFRSTFEILLQTFGRSPAGSGPGGQQLRMLGAFDGLWRRIFSDAPLPRSRRVALESLTIATLMGLALQQALSGARGREPRAELELLAGTLSEQLAAVAHGRAPGRSSGKAAPQRRRRKVS